MRILQPGVGPVTGDHYLMSSPDHVLWGRLPARGDAPLLTVRAGETVTFDTVSHEGILDDQGSDPARFFAAQGVPREQVLDDAVAIAASVPRDPAADGPHVVTGPVAVEGAEPGDVLVMRVERLLPRVPYGVVSNRHGRGALPDELPAGGRTVSVFARVDESATVPRGVMRRGGPDAIDRLEAQHAVGAPDAADGEDVSFPLAPFLGLMGVATDTAERAHSVPPGLHGGNIDVTLLTEGATLYLPVQVPGALAYVGDPHFVQGDGEVALTAMEASLRATIRFDVIKAGEARARFGRARGPVVETGSFLVPTGLDRDLNEAMRTCVENALELLGASFGMDRRHAFAYLSAATDFDVSQVVDQVKGVHAKIRKADFDQRGGAEQLTGAAALPARIAPEAAQQLAALPTGLGAAFVSYERALMTDDQDALAEAFAGGQDVFRADSAGVRIGADQLRAFRGGRGGLGPRRIESAHAHVLADDAVLLTASAAFLDGGRSQITQLWERGASGEDGSWRITGAHVTPRARAIDASVWRVVGAPLLRAAASGPLSGLRVAVKDLYSVRGFAVGAGNPAYLADAEPSASNAWAVDRLLEAGARVEGITQTDEFAYSIAGMNDHTGTPPNPAAPTRISGGSSSGSASAVALGQADIGLGTDTGGSIRVPASYQGLWGIRTTHGAVPRDGLLPLAPSFDTVGWLARDAATLANVAGVLVPQDSASVDGVDLVTLHIGALGLEAAAAQTFAGVLASIRSTWRVDDAQIPPLPAVHTAFRVVQAAEAWRSHGRWVSQHWDALGPAVRGRFRDAEAVSADDEANALADKRRLAAAIDAELGDRVLVLPAAAGAAPLRGADPTSVDATRTATLRITSVAGITGRPAVALPAAAIDGAPFGITLVGPRGSDRGLIRLAARVSEVLA